jgi:N-methylhydantoinase A
VPLDALAGANGDASLAAARHGTRPVWFAGEALETPLYRRHLLPRDAVLDGPAIIEQLDCTTVVEPGNRVRLDALGNLVIEVAP